MVIKKELLNSVEVKKYIRRKLKIVYEKVSLTTIFSQEFFDVQQTIFEEFQIPVPRKLKN